MFFPNPNSVSFESVRKNQVPVTIAVSSFSFKQGSQCKKKKNSQLEKTTGCILFWKKTPPPKKTLRFPDGPSLHPCSPKSKYGNIFDLQRRCPEWRTLSSFCYWSCQFTSGVPRVPDLGDLGRFGSDRGSNGWSRQHTWVVESS